MAEKTEFKTVETSQEDLEELEEKIRIQAIALTAGDDGVQLQINP